MTPFDAFLAPSDSTDFMHFFSISCQMFGLGRAYDIILLLWVPQLESVAADSKWTYLTRVEGSGKNMLEVERTCLQVLLCWTCYMYFLTWQVLPCNK